MVRQFRSYHRFLAPILALPLAMTVLTGMAATMVLEWPLPIAKSSKVWLIKLHTGELFHLEAIYPILNGLGLLGLLITGISMTSLFRKRTRS